MSFIFNGMHWLQLHYLETIATLAGLLYVVYTIRDNLLLWFFGIVSSALYVWIFYDSGLFAYGTLYIYYVVIGFYGWYNWSHRKHTQEGKDTRLVIHAASPLYLSACIVICIIGSIPIYLALKKFTPVSNLAWADAFLTTSGMVATWMLTQKLIEQWLFWIIIDIISCAVMIYKGLYPSSFLFLAYTFLAVKGYIEWKKKLVTQITK